MLQFRHMTTLQRLESTTNDATIGGFVITFPSGAARILHWQAHEAITPLRDAAKKYAAAALQTCIDEDRRDDADRTNWASVTAAVQRIVSDWNDKLRIAQRGSAH